MLHSTVRALRYFGALGSCAAFVICTVFVARSEAQGGKQADAMANSSQAAPLFGIKIQRGYRDWKLISVAHEEGNLNDIRAILGNDVAIKAYREGKLPFPDGSIIARIAWKDVPQRRTTKPLGAPNLSSPGLPQIGTCSLW
jgi:hypothetical protein